MTIIRLNAALLALALGTGNAAAFTDGTWAGNSSGNWSDASKWLDGVDVDLLGDIPDGAGATADLANVSLASSNKIITLDTPGTIGILKLGASGRNLDLNGSNILTLDGNGSNAEITFRSGGRNGSTGVAIELKSNLLITNPDSGGNNGILISGGLSSSNGSLTITNNSNLNSRTKFNSTVSDGAPGNSITYSQTAGWTEFNNANTFTGSTTNVAGSMVLGNSLALQNSALDTTASGVGNNGDPGNGLKIRGVTALTLGGLTGNKAFASLFNTVINSHNLGYGALTALTLNPGTGVTNSYSGAIANGAANMTLTKTGAGTQILSGVNGYTGATNVNVGTLKLDSAGSIDNSARISIAAGGTFDVSAIPSYTLSGSTALSASGTGTGAGTQATIIGGTTVSLGSQGITLTWGGDLSGTDSAHPCLVVSQGALTLNNNALTINGGSLLGNGTYTLISVTGGTINQNGSPSYSVTGTAIDGTKTNVVSVSGGSVILTVTTPAGYATWALAKGLDGSNNGTTQDPNNNGIFNLMEYVLNGSPLLAESPQLILPTLDASGSNFVFTFTRRVDSAADTTQVFDYGTTLTAWTHLTIPAAAGTYGAIVVGSPTGTAPNQVQLVTITISKAGNTTLFGRLQATQP